MPFTVSHINESLIGEVGGLLLFYLQGWLLPMRKWFYVLELTGGHYYAGISNNIVRRARQHQQGHGAVWTQLHPPIRVLFQHEHDVADDRAAERIENEMTVQLMVEHGWKRVRGGYFSATSEEQAAHSLRAHGYWDRVLQSTIEPAQKPSDWDGAIQDALRLAVSYHESGGQDAARDLLVASLMSLRQHRYWSSDFDPGLEEQFWGRRGILRVLLTFQVDRVIGSKLQDPYAVLCAGMHMGRAGSCPWGHLFLAAWEAFNPTATPAQQESVRSKFGDRSTFAADHRFDAFVSVLFPPMRARLRLLPPTEN
jgi:predicted GIY-YIG superfamily endonuclease